MDSLKEISSTKIGEGEGGMTSSHRRFNYPWQLTLSLIIIAAIVIGVVYYLFVDQGPKRTSAWQAVFLSNGQTYFGRIEQETREEMVLSEIYYLQVSNPLQQDGQPSPRGELSLVKLGNELHGPKDRMIINKDFVLFTEDLKDDGKVVEAIMRHQAGTSAPTTEGSE